MFMGMADRRFWKPPCSSALTDRQWARAGGSSGSKAEVGCVSLRYSAMARVSQTFKFPISREGTRNDGDNWSSSARVDASSMLKILSMNWSDDMRHSSQARIDQAP